MLIPQKISKTKTLLVSLVIVVIFGTMVYFILSDYLSIGTSSDLGTAEANLINRPTIETDFETDFLKREPYTKLKKFGQWPVKIGKTGRDNPFQILEILEF